MKKLSIYSKASNDGYPNTTRRFELIRKIEDFNTILDFGSGPCTLLNWLKSEKIKCRYEAYDTRNDSLDMHCQCIRHYTIPKERYDLVCALGVFSLVADRDPYHSKAAFKSTMHQAASLSKKYLLVSFSCQTRWPNYIVPHSYKEACDMINSVEFDVFLFDHDPQMLENIFLCIKSCA